MSIRGLGGFAAACALLPVLYAAPARAQAPRVSLYGGVDYLLWWMNGAKLPVPLVSTGPIETTHHGFVSSPDTTILYGGPHSPAMGGNDTQDFAGFSGSRITIGGWIDPARTYAVEGSGFLLQQRSAGFAIQSNQNGLPIINIPVFNTIPYTPGGGRPGGLPPNEDGLPASLPLEPNRFDGNAGVFAGGVRIRNTLQLWGADLTGVAVIYRSPSLEVSGLAGLQYLDLSESFGLLYHSTGVSGVYTGQSGSAFDSFKTTNRFYGAGIGVRAVTTYGPWSVQATGRIAIGASSETLSVQGGYQALNFPTVGLKSGPEGVFAQPANEGKFSSTRFAVVPQGQVKLGYDVTPWLRLTVGYEVLYDSDVIRPGDQISRFIPKGQTFEQALVPPSLTSPVKRFRSTDFLAQGVTIGASFRF
jgi:hypothetical protein